MAILLGLAVQTGNPWLDPPAQGIPDQTANGTRNSRAFAVLEAITGNVNLPGGLFRSPSGKMKVRVDDWVAEGAMLVPFELVDINIQISIVLHTNEEASLTLASQDKVSR